MARETLRALHYVTTEATDKSGRILGLIHRDISPHNIFVCFDGQVKLTDFGVAKVQESGVKTQVGITKGKLGYMSPEQLMGSPLDFRSDLYNVAILLFESITGRQLFAGGSTAEFLQAMVRGIVPPIPPNLQVPPELENVIRRALDRDRTRRPPTALEFERELGEIADRYGLTAQSAHIAHQMRELYGKVDAPPQLVKPMTAPQKLRSMMLAAVDAPMAAALAGPGFQAGPGWQPQPVSSSGWQPQPVSQAVFEPAPQPQQAPRPQPAQQASQVWQQPVSSSPSSGYQSPYAKPQPLAAPPGVAIADDDFATIVRPIEPEARPVRQPHQRPPSRPAAPLPPDPTLPMPQPRQQVSSARIRSMPVEVPGGTPSSSPPFSEARSGAFRGSFDQGTSEQTNPLAQLPSQSQSSSSRRPATVARGNARPLEALPSMPRPSAPPIPMAPARVGPRLGEHERPVGRHERQDPHRADPHGAAGGAHVAAIAAAHVDTAAGAHRAGRQRDRRAQQARRPPR